MKKAIVTGSGITGSHLIVHSPADISPARAFDYIPGYTTEERLEVTIRYMAL